MTKKWRYGQRSNRRRIFVELEPLIDKLETEANANEEFEFRAAHIDDHGLCPTCGKSVRRFENDDKITHTCDACGYHDVTFKWGDDDPPDAPTVRR